MNDGTPSEYLDAVRAALPCDQAALLVELHAFTGERLRAARACRERALGAIGDDAATGPELHAFLRECWEVLDGLAREVNAVMHGLFPGARLFPPAEMTRQCTFYVVRKNLHEHPDTADHPVSRLLWHQTRERPAEAYRILSFLYNASLFVPLSLTGEGRLPGSADLPEVARGLVRATDVPSADPGDALSAIVVWLDRLVSDCRGLLSEARNSEG